MPVPQCGARRAHRSRTVRSTAPRSYPRPRAESVTLRDSSHSGHWPTLLAAFLYFDLSFCVWSLLGPLGNFIAEDLALSASEKGMLIATPLLGGSLCRIVMGALTDRIGPRRTGLIGIMLTFLP